MKIYIVYCIVTADTKKKQNYVLSTDSKDIVLPICEITSARTLHNEIRYNVKKMFDADIIRFIEEILVSYTDIETEPTIKYIENINQDNRYDLNQDLFILCGIVMEKKQSKTFKWKKYDFSQDAITNPLFSIIDLTIQKSLI